MLRLRIFKYLSDQRRQGSKPCRRLDSPIKRFYMKEKKAKYDTAIIGAGFAGLGAAIRLKAAGNNNFILFERAASVGGTWRDNVYPGCGCDVPSLLYSYSFELNPNWSRSFSKQPEILDYINYCVEKYNLLEHIQFHTAIQHLEFEERFGYWTLTDQDGQTTTAKTVVAAIGPLNVPIFPKINGWENFEGVFFHSSIWPQNFDPMGKRIAIIGTGASAIQLVPEIAPKAQQLYVFQRTAPWILPKRDRRFSTFTKNIFNRFPAIQRMLRELIYWLMELQGEGLFGNKTISNIATRIAKYHIKKSISDPVLREKVLPNYQIGCKRVLPSNNYYPALERPNVELVTEPIDTIETGAITSKKGNSREVDAIIYATGFEAAEFNNRGMTIIGRGGRNLFEEWKNTGAESFYGITTSGFPGLLFMLGPNTGLGHTSVIHMMESQLNYIIDYLEKLKALPANNYLDLKLDVQKDFNEKIQKRLANMVWASGCKSWYQTAAGKNTTLWPGHTYTYRKLTKRVDLEDYEKVESVVGKKQTA